MAIPDSDDGEFHIQIPTTGAYKTAFFFDKQAGTGVLPGYTEKVFNQQGPPGPQGSQGDPGQNGATLFASLAEASETTTVEAGTTGLVDIHCPTGTTRIISKGYEIFRASGVASDVQILSDYVFAGMSRYVVEVYNHSANDVDLKARIWAV
jgi:hypothetical protein